MGICKWKRSLFASKQRRLTSTEIVPPGDNLQAFPISVWTESEPSRNIFFFSSQVIYLSTPLSSPAQYTLCILVSCVRSDLPHRVKLVGKKKTKIGAKTMVASQVRLHAFSGEKNHMHLAGIEPLL